MSDPNSLLATLAQSSAAIVAIVGGFLVSRLVALSSEREGIRRQVESIRDRLRQVDGRFQEAHSYRFDNSAETFTGWVLGDVVKASATTDFEELLADNIPRGSSMDEMRRVLDEIRLRVDTARSRVNALLHPGDTLDLKLEDLIGRGLQVNEGERELYELIADEVSHLLPRPPFILGSFRALPPLPLIGLNSGDHVTEMRRLDESIREEQQLAAERQSLQTEEARLNRELASIGRPTGVISALLILAAYSVLGILIPLVVMAANPKSLAGWQSGLLIGAFTAGLLAVLGYCLWYWRSLGSEAKATP